MIDKWWISKTSFQKPQKNSWNQIQHWLSTYQWIAVDETFLMVCILHFRYRVSISKKWILRSSKKPGNKFGTERYFRERVSARGPIFKVTWAGEPILKVRRYTSTSDGQVAEMFPFYPSLLHCCSFHVSAFCSNAIALNDGNEPGEARESIVMAQRFLATARARLMTWHGAESFVSHNRLVFPRVTSAPLISTWRSGTGTNCIMVTRQVVAPSPSKSIPRAKLLSPSFPTPTRRRRRCRR